MNVTMRSRLLQQLDGFGEYQFIYISAPAGYGKSTLAKQWAEFQGLYYILSPDAFDLSSQRLMGRLCGALSALFPANRHLKRAVSDNADLPDVVSMLSAETGLLIIDDFHRIAESRDNLETAYQFIGRLPKQVRVVLCSRCKMPGGISGMWLKGRFAELPPQELLFTPSEIAQLWRYQRRPITSAAAESIHKTTAGWAMALHTILLAEASAMGGEINRRLKEYVRGNILSELDAPAQELVLRSAIAKNLTPELCDSLTGLQNSGLILRNLADSHSFILEDGGVYRFHSMFRRLLQDIAAERGEQYVLDGLKNAGRWFLQQGDFYSAADFFIEAKDCDGLLQSFNILRRANRNYFDVEKMLGILRQDFLRGIANENPLLSLMLAWAACCESDNINAEYWLDKFYLKHKPGDVPEYTLARFLDYRVSLESTAEAADDVPRFCVPISVGLPLFHCGVRDYSEFCEGFQKDKMLMEQRLGKLRDKLGFVFGDESRLLFNCITAGLHYERGDIQAAYIYSHTATTYILRDTPVETRLCAASMQLLIAHETSGNAPELSEKLIKLAGGSAILLAGAEAVVTRLALKGGNRDAAYGWLSKYASAKIERASLIRSYIDFTTAMAYIALGDYDSAINVLAKLMIMCDAHQRVLDKIRTNVLLAIALHNKRKGFQHTALEHLQDAIVMAYPYGFTQIFAEQGAGLLVMLRKLYNKAVQEPLGGCVPPGHVKNLFLAAEERSGQKIGLVAPAEPQSSEFTPRQQEIMALIAEGHSFRSVAEALGIKMSTVRSHIELIYKKLDAANNADAVRKIRAMGVVKD